MNVSTNGLIKLSVRIRDWAARRLGLSTQRKRTAPRLLSSGDLLQPARISIPEMLPGGRTWPRISVITPSYNHGRFIAETIDSVLGQKYPNVEHIIIDGGSTDDTVSVLERYRTKVSHITVEPDRGQSHALNKGFGLASGDILCWLNSDDQFAPGALFAVAMAFATHDVDVVSGICEIYRNDELVHRHMTSCTDGEIPLAELLDLDTGWNAGQFFYQPEVFFTASLWSKAGAYVDERAFYSMDYELWCRFARAGARLHVIGAPLARFRVHPDQKTAHPARFKKELIQVRDAFAAKHDMAPADTKRPAVNFDRRLRVAMINDAGLLHGAGIAHGRLAAGIEMAGHSVLLFTLQSVVDHQGVPDDKALFEDVRKFAPDLVIFGNLHSATRDSTRLVGWAAENYPTFWVTHDFWIMTGRCAYPGDCTKYLRGCDEACPTASEYPDLAKSRIFNAWSNKQALMGGTQPPYVLANSGWSKDFMKRSLSVVRTESDELIHDLRLGVPVDLFQPIDRSSARRALGLKQENFTIAFSASSLSEKRKGGQILLEALRDINLPDLTVLVIGSEDVEFELVGIEVISMGYITDHAKLVAVLSASDVYVGPSTQETFGQVFIEAAMTGVASIGFDQSGVRDSIVDGVTGLRVPSTIEALRCAITKMYNDPELCRNLGAWARIYALNEFSLESAYRSIFSVWRNLSLIDKWRIPHKIGFSGKSSAGQDAGRTLTAWRALDGISGMEGPYPQFKLPQPFRWCHGKQSRISIHCVNADEFKVRFFYYSTLFETLRIELRLNEGATHTVDIRRTLPDTLGQFEFKLRSREGGNIIDIFPESFHEPTQSEPRALTFMLHEVVLERVAA